VSLLSPAERKILRALADAALPPGQLLPSVSESALDRCEVMLKGLPFKMSNGYRAMLWTLETGAVLRFGGRFSTLPLGRRLRVLEAMHSAEATRLVVRALLSPLKLGYLDDPTVYAALGCRYVIDPPKQKEKPRWQQQVTSASTLPAGETLECDVVVVGTGAGGAPMAAKLAEAGHAVLLLEEGEHFTRADFTGRPVDMIRKLYRKGGLTASLGNHVIPIPIGKGVGGTTLINSGTCFRVPEKTLAAWHKDFGLSELTHESLDPHYREVEKELGVGANTPQALGAPARLIAQGCDALGYSHHPLKRNAPECDGQGMCCFGCPTDAKRSTNVSWVPRALERGAQLLTGFKVTKVLTEGERAVGVEGVAGGHTLTVRAKVVVLACGTLHTPLLLKDGLANTSDMVGRNLSIHPASAAVAMFDEEVNPSRTVPQGYAIDHFTAEGLMFEGGTIPLELTGVTLTGFGPSYVAAMEQFSRSFGFGFMVKDTSRGRVRPGPDGEPLITYWLNDHDQALMQRGFSILSRVFFAAGARQVHPGVAGWETLRSLADVEKFEAAKIDVRQFDLTAYHPLGTCRMGKDPYSSVIDPNHETHDVHNLFICDGSAMPGSLGVNPQLTIMAMSLRAAEAVDRRLARA
jgi:choline dehydrogenase-like flavoprotein